MFNIAMSLTLRVLLSEAKNPYLSPLPARERMKVRVLIQRAIALAIHDSASAPKRSRQGYAQLS